MLDEIAKLIAAARSTSDRDLAAAYAAEATLLLRRSELQLAELARQCRLARSEIAALQPR